MEMLGDAQEIGGTHRLGAPVQEVRHGAARRSARHLDVATLGAQHARLAVGAVGHGPERLVELLVRPGAERGQVDIEIAQALHAVVLGAAQLEHFQPLLDQLDEGQEPVALQAVLVEIVGRAVGGRDHRHALVEQHLEEAREDHRIGDVGDLEFVEAEQPGLRRNCPGDRHDRVVLGRRTPGRQLLAAAVQALVHLEHELVEVHAALLRHRRVGEEEIHQHRLAAADRSPDVEAVRAGWRLRRATHAQPLAEPRPESGFRRMRGQGGELVVHGLQAQHHLFLHRIGMDLAGGTACREIGDRPLAGREDV